MSKTELAGTDARGYKGVLGKWLGYKPVAPSYRPSYHARIVDLDVAFEQVNSAQTALESKLDQEPETQPDPFLAGSHLPPVEVDPVLVELLFGGSSEQAPAPPQQSVQPLDEIPGGLHDNATLARLMASTVPFSGVVAHIALNDLESAGDVPRLLPRFIASLLQENDFACLVAEDEFVIVSPGPQGSEARRRLDAIGERLWSFQLGISPGSLTPFSWGGVEATDERLLDVVTAATERMLQTKRFRKTVYINSASTRK